MAKTYAMICNGRVIEILYDQEVAPVWPPDMMGNPVTALECPEEATRDWAYDAETCTVYEPQDEEPTEEERVPTGEEKQAADIAYLVMKAKGSATA